MSVNYMRNSPYPEEVNVFLEDMFIKGKVFVPMRKCVVEVHWYQIAKEFPERIDRKLELQKKYSIPELLSSIVYEQE